MYCYFRSVRRSGCEDIAKFKGSTISNLYENLPVLTKMAIMSRRLIVLPTI